MFAPKIIFWEVDVQRDFMLPGGKLYVPEAEKILPNINRLVEAVRQRRAFLISSADAHSLDDPELRQWPPHCLKDSPGAELLPEARVTEPLVVPNDEGYELPEDFSAIQQVILQKNTLSVFDNPQTDKLLKRLHATSPTPGKDSPEFFVFGVVTELCVHCAAEGLLQRGRRVSLVIDAVKSLDDANGRESLEALRSRGARLLTTEAVPAQLGAKASQPTAH